MNVNTEWLNSQQCVYGAFSIAITTLGKMPGANRPKTNKKNCTMCKCECGIADEHSHSLYAAKRIVNLYNPHYTWKFIVLVNGRIWKFISQFFYNTHDIFIDWKYIPVLVTIQNVFCCFFLCEVLFQCQYFMPKLTVTKKHAQPEYIRSFILVSVRH